MLLPGLLLLPSLAQAQATAGSEIARQYRTPGGTRYPAKRPGGESILPGGRIITPIGRQFQSGPGTWGLAVSPNGKRIVSADGGPNRFSLTMVEQQREGWRTQRINIDRKEQGAPEEPDELKSVSMGIAFASPDTVYVSEGNSGRVRLLELPEGKTKHIYELNTLQVKDSFSSDLAYDAQRQLLYVVDQANFRIVVLDVKRHRTVASVAAGRLPFAIALSADGKRLYVTNLGIFEYQAIPGADKKRARETGLDFPAFGFPSEEARQGADRTTATGTPVRVPGLGEPTVKEANSLAAYDVSEGGVPKLLRFIPTGVPFQLGIQGGSSPSGVVVHEGKVYVANAHNDSITVVNEATLEVEKQILIRVPGLESLRGVLPTGLAIHQGHLLVAEAGINAVGVIDLSQGKVTGHIPTAWFPTRVVSRDGLIYVGSAKGHGTGPNASMTQAYEKSFQLDLRRGSIAFFPFPDATDLAKHTRRVWENNGFVAQAPGRGFPEAIRHVVVIVKENRTFDEVFGDVVAAGNGPVNSAWDLARFGRYGVVGSSQGELRQRLLLRNIAVTPNHHLLAERFAFSDNFYADSEVSVDGHHWLVGSYPNAWTESTLMASYGGQKNFRFPTTAPGRLLFADSNSSVHPEEINEAGTLWHHLERHQIPFRNFGEGFELAGVDEGAGLKPTGARYLTNMPMPDPLYRNTSHDYPNYNMNIPDQYRANQFIREIERLYIDGHAEFPRFVYIHLPGDHTTRPRPEDGYPYQASYVADNDYALGRIVEFLSKSPWWKSMAIFVTEDDAQGGVDHVDSHRTVMMVASPYAKKNYVSKANSSFPGLLKSVFGILRLPPLNLFDATAQDLSDLFTETPDFTPYTVQPIRPELFEPSKARDPLDPKPQPRMDDPNFLREQHEQKKP